MKIPNILIVFTLTLLILAMNTNAQVKNYDADWKQVEENIVKGLPASALTIVKKYMQKLKLKRRKHRL
ncbi:hypothetical protein [Niabella ginsengisoli]|uniref:Uncharacterized protein n=1 Tax=Niabella ginsengisoli TaxID=522298 RepID=A0ABS9SL22_9BACT|nr:hypothetical protein [Niabella ginsengisoli]MCH5599055.1 hypothetical protein [Niabella ginsengisoli]